MGIRKIYSRELLLGYILVKNKLLIAAWRHSSTGTVICDVASDKAECSGRLTSYRAVNGTTSFTATADITTTITGVSANLVPATITKGFEKLPPTSTSTGGASALVIQPALLIGGAAAILGGAFML